ncbi:MAG: hypothetical protein WCH58_04115 [Candidatus Saccharibacteria bacterium]
MKKTDIAMIVLIISVSVLVAYFGARAAFPKAYSGSTTVDTIDKIISEVKQPSPSIFNKDAINPTVKVEIKGTK